MVIHGLSESEARFVALAVDTHDKQTTTRELRVKIQRELVERLHAPDHTEALKRARAIRKACVHRGIYTRPTSKGAANPVEARRDRPKRRFEPRTSTN